MEIVNFTQLQILYYTHTEFAIEVKRLIDADTRNLREVAEMINVPQKSLSAQLGQAIKGERKHFDILRSIYITLDEHVKDVAQTNIHVLCLYGDLASERETDTSPLVPIVAETGDIAQVREQVRELMQEGGVSFYAIEKHFGWLKRDKNDTLQRSKRAETALKAETAQAVNDLALIYEYLNGGYVSAEFVFVVTLKLGEPA